MGIHYVKKPHGDPHFRFIHSFVLLDLLPCELMLGDLRAVIFWEKHWSLDLIFGFVSLNHPFDFFSLIFWRLQEG